MKKLLLLLFFSNYFIGFSQISVSESPNRKTKKLNAKTIERFKKTETIFVLPNSISKESYNSILKQYWNITPYKIIDFETFSFKNYLNDEYSFVYLNTSVKTIDKSRSINVYIYATLNIFMLKNKEIKDLLSKKKKKTSKIFESNKIQLASIFLYPKNEYLKTIANLRNNEKELIEFTYTQKAFYDFNAGFFKNGIQKINYQLKKSEPYYLYESDFLPEIKNLATHKLYVPEYLGLKFNGMRETNTGKNTSYIKDLFKTYNFEYSTIKTSELSDKIIQKEITYYAKYTRVNTQRFLHIVNAKTGEIIYRKHMPGMAYNLHQKHILNLNNAIRKSIKN